MRRRWRSDGTRRQGTPQRALTSSSFPRPGSSFQHVVCARSNAARGATRRSTRGLPCYVQDDTQVACGALPRSSQWFAGPVMNGHGAARKLDNDGATTLVCPLQTCAQTTLKNMQLQCMTRRQKPHHVTFATSASRTCLWTQGESCEVLRRGEHFVQRI